MLYLFGMLAVTVIAGAVLIRFTLLIMGQRAGKFLAETHGAIEYIHATGAVPPQWLEPFHKKFRQLRPDNPQHQAIVDRNARAARKTCLKKLASLRKYVYNSSLVQDEETRVILLKKFDTVRETWAEQDWSTIINL